MNLSLVSHLNTMKFYSDHICTIAGFDKNKKLKKQIWRIKFVVTELKAVHDFTELKCTLTCKGIFFLEFVTKAQLTPESTALWLSTASNRTTRGVARCWVFSLLLKNFLSAWLVWIFRHKNSEFIIRVLSVPLWQTTKRITQSLQVALPVLARCPRKTRNISVGLDNTLIYAVRKRVPLPYKPGITDSAVRHTVHAAFGHSFKCFAPK